MTDISVLHNPSEFTFVCYRLSSFGLLQLHIFNLKKGGEKYFEGTDLKFTNISENETLITNKGLSKTVERSPNVHTALKLGSKFVTMQTFLCLFI